MEKRGIIALASFAFLLVLVSFVSVTSATSVSLTEVNSTLAYVSITGAANLYGYEVNLDYNGSMDSVSFYNYISADSSGTDTTTGHNEKDSISSVYESRLDHNRAAISGSGLLFNFTHTGSVSLRYAVFVDNTGAETYVYYNETAATTTTTTTPNAPNGGGGGTIIQQIAIKIVTPGDITVSDKNYIEVPLLIKNPGNVALKGINLSTKVSFNDQATQDVQVALAKAYIDEIGPDGSENITIRVQADTKKFGVYRVTVFCDVTSPKLSDSGDFYINLMKVNASEAEQTIIYAEKLIAGYSGCLELTEITKKARQYFNNEDFRSATGEANRAISACKLIVSSSTKLGISKQTLNQIILIVSIVTLVIIVAALIFYIYRKARFNKSKSNYY